MMGRRKLGFVEKTLQGLSSAFDQSSASDHLSNQSGLLQLLDPRVKVVGMLLLIIATAAARQLWVIGLGFAIALILALASQVSIGVLAKRVWISALLFTGAIALPALFLTRGVVLWQIPLLGWRITAQGINSAAFLIARVLTSATLAITLILTTPWNHVLKSLRVLRVPVVFVVILGMTYRYIFVMLQVAHDMFESRQSRAVGQLDAENQRRLATASVGVLLSKSFQLSNDVYMAMQSRGFLGEVYLLDDFKMQPHDWIALFAFVLVSGLVVWFGAGR